MVNERSNKVVALVALLATHAVEIHQVYSLYPRASCGDRMRVAGRELLNTLEGEVEGDSLAWAKVPLVFLNAFNAPPQYRFGNYSHVRYFDCQRSRRNHHHH